MPQTEALTRGVGASTSRLPYLGTPRSESRAADLCSSLLSGEVCLLALMVLPLLLLGPSLLPKLNGVALSIHPSIHLPVYISHPLRIYFVTGGLYLLVALT